MSGVCQKHERYIPEGEECPYCEPVAVAAPPHPSDACDCGCVSMSGIAQDWTVPHADGLSHSRLRCVKPSMNFWIRPGPFGWVLDETSKETK